MSYWQWVVTLSALAIAFPFVTGIVARVFFFRRDPNIDDTGTGRRPEPEPLPLEPEH